MTCEELFRPAAAQNQVSCVFLQKAVYQGFIPITNGAGGATAPRAPAFRKIATSDMVPMLPMW
jgi:hypothetical protein